MLIPCAFVQRSRCGSYPAMAGNPAGYDYSSGYGSDPAMDGNSAEYPGSSGYEHDSIMDAQYRFGSKDLNKLRVPTTTSRKEHTRWAPYSTGAPYLICLHAGCDYQTKRQYDYDRHQKTHFPPDEKFDCTGRGCGRTGEYGFDRKDLLREHLRKVHAKDIPNKSRKGAESAPRAVSAPTFILSCLHPGCEFQTKRQYDLERHQKSHFPPDKEFDCPGRGCGRQGKNGFSRKDHLREHLRKVHAIDIKKNSRKREAFCCLGKGCRWTDTYAVLSKDNPYSHLLSSIQTTS